MSVTKQAVEAQLHAMAVMTGAGDRYRAWLRKRFGLWHADGEVFTVEEEAFCVRHYIARDGLSDALAVNGQTYAQASMLAYGDPL